MMASMASSWLLLEIKPDVVPVARTEWMSTATVLERSRSETVSVPEVERPAFDSLRALLSLLPAPTAKLGASLVPVRVTVSVVWLKPPRPSERR